MPLPLTVSCFSEIQIGFTFLVLAHPGSPGKRAVKRVCVPDNFLPTLFVAKIPKKQTRHSMLPVVKKKIHKCLGIKNCSYLLNCFESEITRFTEKQTEIFELINFTNGMQNYHGSGTSSQHIVTLDYCARYKYWWSEWHWKKYTGQL